MSIVTRKRNGTMDKQPLLSICIPTWNRSKILSMSLDCFRKQLSSIDLSEIELFVSDNCSDDDTPQVVQSFIEQGLPITYNRNTENIGAAGNFIKCMQWASGKYIWLLGDDDLIEDDAINYLLEKICKYDYGLIHIHQFKDIESECVEYNNLDSFYNKISYWLTFMSGSIFRKEIVKYIDSSKYVKTHLLQMPYYILSAAKGEKNLLVNKKILHSSIDSANNGGYNFYEVFVRNYLDIWYEGVKKGLITESCYKHIKKDIYVNFIIRYNYMLLVRHKNVKPENASYVGNRKGFKIAGAKNILEKYYGNEIYYKMSWIFYIKSMCKYYIKKIYQKR